ncbi:hypothetical protein PM015_03070 [Halorubrum ezzemoulense]|uniref:hypothetical protein n=1 Tax=Halorubrum ezzemoulense TaxID=337243 RepID=UPI00232CA2E5|nr:hypothetical protein [Halorubrum ezzemoulense]MDB2243743.1 hypothetical protein [Halorubrum ezzemoulense]MDB2251809.1 hypothetical protein [Halorubrum ezzemoulense]MDB2277479.1 hypothetical protein [Halorubrum ezzemoulense]
MSDPTPSVPYVFERTCSRGASTDDRRANVLGTGDTPAGPDDRLISRDPFGDAEEPLDAREIDDDPDRRRVVRRGHERGVVDRPPQPLCAPSPKPEP